MKSYSLFTILLLCTVILVIDIFAFYGLQLISKHLFSKNLLLIINILFWVFTVGLIISIIILKITLDQINPKRKHLLVSSLYGLTISSFIPKLIFVLILSIFYISNFSFSGSRALVIIPIIGLISGFLPFFIIVYSITLAAYRFKIYHINIHFDALPQPIQGLRIIQISDIHLGSFNYRFHILEKAIKKINHLKPDYIFFTGDLINNYAWELRGWEPIFKRLEAKYGKYAVLGNHDYGDYSQWETEEAKNDNFMALKKFYQEIDFKLLCNENEIINHSGAHFALIGVENWGKPPFKQYGNLKKALDKTKDISFKILLSHDPSHWNEEVIKESNIALTLSGHTHGMQAGFQYKQMQWSPIKYKYKHWAGLYKIKDQYLHVNRGLGWLGFPGRIGMRPEITLIELRNN